MALIINIIAAIILFVIPIRMYSNRDIIMARRPFDSDVTISVNYELWFLIYSVVTAMIFLGPLSLVKYVYWIIFLLFLVQSGRIQIKIDFIVASYLLFIAWNIISAIVFSTAKFQALMLIIKYFLPLLYLWLGYTAIRDEDDLFHFMKIVTIGMCVYALIIGGFSSKFYMPIYALLIFKTGGLFTSYASLADYFSSLIVLPIGLYIISKDKKWIYATLWIVLSTILDTVRTGLGGIFLASSLLLFTIYRGKAVPWIAGLCIVGVVVVFTVPSFKEKMFKDENVSVSTLSVSNANFDHIQSNAREYLWEINLKKFYEPYKITGAGLGESTEWMKNRPGLHLIHSDYVQMLCETGLIGISLFGLFAAVTLFSIISSAWASDAPFVLKLTGGMALGSCAGTFFSMAFDNVVTYAQQSFVIPFIMLGIFIKVKELYENGQWDLDNI